MINDYVKIVSILTFALSLTYADTLLARSQSMDAVEAEIRGAVLKEQEAFRIGDCDTVLNLMADNITFHPTGAGPVPRATIARFCKSIPRPFSALTSESLRVYALSEDVGYVVRKLSFDKDDSTQVDEVVTKIWNKVDGEWKMQHLQSTVVETPKGAPSKPNSP